MAAASILPLQNIDQPRLLKNYDINRYCNGSFFCPAVQGAAVQTRDMFLRYFAFEALNSTIACGRYDLPPLPGNLSKRRLLCMPPNKKRGHRSRNGLNLKLPLLDLNQGPTD